MYGRPGRQILSPIGLYMYITCDCPDKCVIKGKCISPARKGTYKEWKKMAHAIKRYPLIKKNDCGKQYMRCTQGRKILCKLRRDSAWKRHFYEDLRSNNTYKKYSSEQHQFCDLRDAALKLQAAWMAIAVDALSHCSDALKNFTFHGNNFPCLFSALPSCPFSARTTQIRTSQKGGNGSAHERYLRCMR